MKNVIFVVIAILGFINSNAQQKGIFEYNDGRIVKGTLKNFESDTKIIKIKDDKKKYKIEDIETMFDDYNKTCRK